MHTYIEVGLLIPSYSEGLYLFCSVKRFVCSAMSSASSK